MLPSVCAFERSSEMLCALLVWPIRDTRIIIYMAFWIVIRNESCAFGCYSKHSCCLGPLISEFSFSYSVLSCQQFSIWTTRSLGPSTITAVCVMMMVQDGYTECLSLVYILNLICIWYTTLLGYWSLSARLFMLKISRTKGIHLMRDGIYGIRFDVIRHKLCASVSLC